MKYPEKESSVLEFKQKLPAKQQIIKTIIGFCNQFGGRLVVGVSDDGTITGLPEESVDETMEALHKSLYESCTPTVLPLIYTQRIQDKIILLIEVSSGMNKPYFITSLGLNEGCYVRAGLQTVKATPSMIQELQWQARGKELDKMPVYSAIDNDLDIASFMIFLRNRGIETPEWREMALHYDVLVEEHKRTFPSIAGILLFGKNPQRALSEAFIICTQFKGVQGREAIASVDCTGTLFEQYQKGLLFLTSRLYRSFAIRGAGPRQEQLEIPEEALREVLLNALVHRDYHVRGPTKIAIFDDRVEVFSPGNFPGPLKPHQLEMGLTYVRNAVIGRVFREAKLTEKLGTGLRTLFASYRERGLDLPHVLEGNGFVKCILPRPDHHKASYKVSNSSDQLQRLLQISDEITVADVMKELTTSKATATRLLKQLVDEGVLIRIGKGPSTRYAKNR
jgi:ATP-dependent DNA helicase RecG